MCWMPSRGHAVRGRLELSPGICNNPFLQHCKVQLGTEDLPDGPQMFLLESKSAAFADTGVPHTRGEKGLVGNSISREGQAGTARHTARGAVMKTAFLLRSPRTRLLIAGECGECQVGGVLPFNLTSVIPERMNGSKRSFVHIDVWEDL